MPSLPKTIEKWLTSLPPDKNYWNTNNSEENCLDKADKTAPFQTLFEILKRNHTHVFSAIVNAKSSSSVFHGTRSSLINSRPTFGNLNDMLNETESIIVNCLWLKQMKPSRGRYPDFVVNGLLMRAQGCLFHSKIFRVSFEEEKQTKQLVWLIQMSIDKIILPPSLVECIPHSISQKYVYIELFYNWSQFIQFLVIMMRSGVNLMSFKFCRKKSRIRQIICSVGLNKKMPSYFKAV